jgi:hypothetical protein
MAAKWNWEVGYDNDTGPNDDYFVEFLCVGPAKIDLPRREGEEKREAVEAAHLMSAAPELLEALKGMRSRFGKTIACLDKECVVCPEEIAITEAADAAIAKAEAKP